MRDLGQHAKLFALWLFVLLNTIFRDRHELANNDFREMLLTGKCNGGAVKETLPLRGSVLSPVLISMVVFSAPLERRWIWLMIFAAVFGRSASMLSTPPDDFDDGLHLGVGLLAMTYIIWTNWTWDVRPSTDPKPAPGGL